ncbi:MAG TPA: hypothetical protein ENJ32_11590 [Crenotrichaceae bacterium]|nr:hypothetical protein [Crenotrichaceae bacterium]
MNVTWDQFPQRNDPRIVILALLATYIVVGTTWLGFNRSATQIVITIGFACLFDMLLHRLFRSNNLLFPLSAAITGASLSILVNYAHGLWFPLVPVFFAISSKYLLTFNGRHVCNPSLFGIVLSLLVADGMISSAPAYQWGGSIAVTLFVITAALLLFVFRIQRTALVGSFLLFYFIALALRAWITRWHMPPETWFMGTLTSPAFYLFAFFMITDPATSPASKKSQVLMAFAIVLLDFVLHKFQTYNTLFYAAFGFFVLRFTWLHARNLKIGSTNGLFTNLQANAYRWLVVVAIATAGSVVYRSGIVPDAIADSGLMFTEINSADAGIQSRPSDLLDRVDPKLRHIGKWILSVGDTVAVNDVNYDGLPDLFLTNSMKLAPDRAALYLNKGRFQFERVPLPALDAVVNHPESKGLPSGALWFDYDKDGDDDLYVVVSFGYPLLLKSLWKETGKVTFIDVTEEQGLNDYVVGISANVLDLNNDGDLDLIVGNTMPPYLQGYVQKTRFNIFDLPEEEYEGDRRMVNVMHRTWYNANNGGENYIYLHTDKGFIKQSSKAMGLHETRWTLGIGTGDFNQDGLTDLYFANDFGPDSLYINQGSLRFARISGDTIGSISRDTYKGMNASIGDLDNNGYLDIYVSNVHEKLQAEGSLLWMNQGTLEQMGSETFQDQAVARNALNEKRFGWGAALGDLDLNGYLDIVQANGMVDDAYDKTGDRCEDFWYWNASIGLTGPDIHGYADRWATLYGRCIFADEVNRVYLNMGGQFVDVAEKVGLGEPGTARGVALSDLDNDGDLDILISRQFAPLSIYQNNIVNKHWIGLELKGNGIHCNTNAVGSRIELISASGDKQVREVHASNGLSAQGDYRLLFGLADDKQVSLKIFWCGVQNPQQISLTSGRYHLIQQEGS